MRTLLIAAGLLMAAPAIAQNIQVPAPANDLADYDTITCRFAGQPTMTIFLAYDPEPSLPREDYGNSAETSALRIGNAPLVRIVNGGGGASATVGGKDYVIEHKGSNRLVTGNRPVSWRATLSIDSGRPIKGKCVRIFRH